MSTVGVSGQVLRSPGQVQTAGDRGDRSAGESVVRLRNGAPVRVRPIRPDDGPRLLALCDRLSPHTVYERFFSSRRLLPADGPELVRPVRPRRRKTGDDDRAVIAHAPAHSISAETTLARDEADAEELSRVLWPLCERVSARLKEASLAAGTVTLKLKTADFRLRTRSHRLADPTQLATTLFRTAAGLLAGEADGSTRFRLIGIGGDTLVDSRAADPPTLFDRELDRPRRLEHAIDQIRGRLGEGSLRLGRGLPRDGTDALVDDIPVRKRKEIG